jgi:hypothetical protein
VQSIRFSNFHNVDRAGIVDDVVVAWSTGSNC